MSKSQGRFLGVIGIVALSIFTFGAGAAVAGGGALLGAGGALAAPAFGGALGGLSLAAIGKIGLALLAIGGAAGSTSLDDTGANERQTPLADPNAHGVFAFGETIVPATLVFEQAHAGLVSNVLAHCWHEIDSYQFLRVNDEEITFNEAVDSSTEFLLPQGDWDGLFQWRRKVGAPGDTKISLPNTDWNDEASRIFRGVAHTAFTWNYRQDSEKLQAGIPRNYSFGVKGALLYDPREDTSVGGSGSQDLEDPTTWTYNDGNAALVLLRYIIGEYAPNGDLIWGRGAGYSDIDMDTFIAMANVADETLDGEPRYKLGGIHGLDGNFQGFVRRWEEETGGKLSKSGGVYRVWLPHDDLTSLTTLTEDDIAISSESIHTVASDIARYFNCARGRYIEPEEGYHGFPYPEVPEDEAITDDGGKRVMYQDFSWVQIRSIAERIARLKVRRSRFQRVWVMPVGWKGFGPDYKPFTVHTLKTKETGYNNQLVRVIDRVMNFEGVVILTLQQEDISLYDDTIPLNDPHASNDVPERIGREETVPPRFVAGLSLKINVGLDGNANAHEAVMVGYQFGTPDLDTSGFVIWENERIPLEREQYTTGGIGYTILTNDSDTTSVGFICFDTAKTDPFTMASIGDGNVAFVRKIGSQWQYDNNSTWVNFSPTDDMIALGVLEKGSSGIRRGSLYGAAMSLDAALAASARHTDGTSIDDSAYSLGLVQDPNFERSTELWEAFGSDDPTPYFWAKLEDTSDIQIFSTGGNVGGVLRIVNAGPSERTAFSLPRKGNVLTAEASIKTTVRLRKRFSSTAAGNLQIGLVPCSLDQSSAGGGALIEVNAATINGWTVDEWQDISLSTPYPTFNGSFPERVYARVQIRSTITSGETPLDYIEVDFMQAIAS